MSQISNQANVKTTNSEKLFVSTVSGDASVFELDAIKALVRDNIKMSNGDVMSATTAGTSGTVTDLTYDFHNVNMINQDIFSSQVHIVHSVYENRGNTDASFIDVSSGAIDLSRIEIDETTAPFVEGNLILDICNGPDDISLSRTFAIEGNNFTILKHRITLSGEDVDANTFTKALLSKTEQSDTNPVLLSITEDASNVASILLDKSSFKVSDSAKLNVVLDVSNAAKDALCSEVESGVYRIVFSTTGVNTVGINGINGPSAALATLVGIRDLCGNTIPQNYVDVCDGTLESYLPNDQGQAATAAQNYALNIQLTTAGNIEIENAAFDISGFSNMANNLDYMNTIRDFGTNKNVLGDISSGDTGFLAHRDVSSHNILITNSITDLSFGGANAFTFTNGTGGTFKVFLDNTQDETLTQNVSGQIKLFTRANTARLDICNNDDISNVMLGSTIAYIGDTAIQGTNTDVSLNSTEVVTYSVKQKFPNPGSTLLDSLTISGGNQTNVVVLKDASSTLFQDTSVNVTFVDNAIQTFQDACNVTFIKITDNNVFATRVNKIFDLVDTDVSFGNPDVQISITGTNVDLSLAGAYNFDQVRLFLEPKTLNDISGDLSSNSDLSFSTSDGAVRLNTKVDFTRDLNDFVWDVLDNGTSLDMSFDIVANYEGDISAHEFQSKIQTLIKKQWYNGSTTKTVTDHPDDYTLNTLATTIDTSVNVGSLGTGSVVQYTKETKHTITEPFYLGAYNNLQVDFSNITIKDVFFEYFHDDGTKGPESKLRNYDVSAASRTITYTEQKRTISKSTLHTMFGQLQGRINGTTDFSNAETKVDIDMGYNEPTTITGFNSSSDAQFVVNLDLDEGDVSLNSASYAILLDFAEGNSTWTLSKKADTLQNMVTGLSSLQDIFDATGFTTDGNLSSVHTVHVVDDTTGKNTLTLKNGSNTFATLTADKTLLANFAVVIANGPVFQSLRHGTNIASDNYLYTDTSFLLIDNGIQLDICENLVNFGNPDMSFNLKKDQVSVAHIGLAGAGADIVGGLNPKLYTHVDGSAQDVSFNNYRGIIENQTIEIRRTGGFFQLDFSGTTQSLSGDLLKGVQIDASMADFGDISMGDLGYDITNSKSHFGTANSLSTSLKAPVKITPAVYTVTGTVVDPSASLAATRTSFSDVLFEFHQNSVTTNPTAKGFFKASLIPASGDGDRYQITSSGGGNFNVRDSGNNQITGGSASASFNNSAGANNDLSFNNVKYPFVVKLLDSIAQDIDVSFTLNMPKFEVKYRNPTNVTAFPYSAAAANNLTTEFLSAATRVHHLTDISASITLDNTRTFINYANDRSDSSFNLDMDGFSNTIQASITYDASINPGISNEFLVIPNTGTDTSSTPITIDKITSSLSKDGKFFQLPMTQLATGLFTTTGYDVCSNLVNSSSNILVKLPSAYMNQGRYSVPIHPNVGMKTSLIGAEYDLSGTKPIVKIRKYTSPLHESFETFKIDRNNVRGVGFRVDTIEEAKIELAEISFGTTAYSFQDVLNTTASSLTMPSYTTVAKNDISGEPIWDNYALNRLNYVMVPLTYGGVGNIFEVTGVSNIKQAKTLIASTPDVTRICSADGAPVFRVRANGRIDTGTVQTSTLVSVSSQTTNSGTNVDGEFVSYNVLLG